MYEGSKKAYVQEMEGGIFRPEAGLKGHHLGAPGVAGHPPFDRR